MPIARSQIAPAWSGYSGELPKKKRRAAARVAPTQVTLVHRPTGIAVSGRVPFRRVSRRRMQDALMKLRKELLLQLERVVRARSARRGKPLSAKALRLPMKPRAAARRARPVWR